MKPDLSSHNCPGCEGSKLPGLHFCGACRRVLPDHMRPSTSSSLAVYASAIRCVKTRRRTPITATETKRIGRFDDRWTNRRT